MLSRKITADLFRSRTTAFRASGDDQLMLKALLYAIRNHDLTVAYQPQYTVDGRRMIGAEALIRWHHASFGRVSPDRFVSLAEAAGVVGRIDMHMLVMVCADLRRWLDSGLAAPPIAVNLSAITLCDAGLPRRIGRCLQCYGIKPQHISLEITETAAVQNEDVTLSVLDRLIEMGFALSLDDFGTGFSGVYRAIAVPASQIKIDRKFVARMQSATDRSSIGVRGIIELAHRLGAHVLAEGVETEAQRSLLESLGCDAVQGYLFARPSAAAEFESRFGKCSISGASTVRSPANDRVQPVPG